MKNRSLVHQDPGVHIQNRARQFADELRERATPAERELCRVLDRERISYVFQSSMCDQSTGRTYIADFRIRCVRRSRPKGMSRKDWRRSVAYFTGKLFVEIDGGYHQDRIAYDARRTRWMASHRGATVLRFTNDDVFTRPVDILAAIRQYNPAIKTTSISWTSAQKHTKIVRKLADLTN